MYYDVGVRALPRQSATLYGSLRPLLANNASIGNGNGNMEQLIEISLNVSARFLPIRLWEIRVAQIPFSQRAPAGCLQYHTGAQGVMQTFNFADNGRHLANQHYRICVRQEADMCSIVYEPCDEQSFRIGGGGGGGSFMSSAGAAGGAGGGGSGSPAAAVAGAGQSPANTISSLMQMMLSNLNGNGSTTTAAAGGGGGGAATATTVQQQASSNASTTAATVADTEEAWPSFGSDASSSSGSGSGSVSTTAMTTTAPPVRSSTAAAPAAESSTAATTASTAAAAAAADDAATSAAPPANDDVEGSGGAEDEGFFNFFGSAATTAAPRPGGVSRRPRPVRGGFDLLGFLRSAFDLRVQRHRSQQRQRQGRQFFSTCTDRITMPCIIEDFIGTGLGPLPGCEPVHCGSQFCSSGIWPCRIESTVTPFYLGVHFGDGGAGAGKGSAEDNIGACLRYSQVQCI